MIKMKDYTNESPFDPKWEMTPEQIAEVFSLDKNKKYKILILIISGLLIISFVILGRELLVNCGYILDSDLKYLIDNGLKVQ